MLDALRKLFLAINAKAGTAALGRDVRRLTALAVRAKADLPARLAGMQEIADFIAAETATWIPDDAVASGRGGPFDTCDLRHWLALAERAGVAAVPARVVLALSEDEMALASGELRLPERARARIAGALGRYLPPDELAAAAEAAETLGNPPDRDAVEEKLAAALDGVPEGWMVRHARGGPSSLKTLAGIGAAGPVSPEVRFGSDLEIGPGWVRRGNRRAIDASDGRIVQVYARGPVGPSVFLARPWAPASRWMVDEDPHRRHSRYAGKGLWPAEWSAFVENGRVTGVGFYYAWAGEVSQASAAAALAVRDLAQRVVDEACRMGAFPLYLDTEIARRNDRMRPALDARFPRTAVACTLDFIETDAGPLLLEGGPPFNPHLGGGHPTAFAGAPDPFEGVAFRCMPGVDVADPKSWRGPHETAGSILSWDEVEALAAEPLPTP